MKRSRSPRFPFIPLEKAIKHLKSLHESGSISEFRPQQAMQELGFSSMHGRAVKIFAAFRAYDLIEKAKSAGKDERLFSITKVGLKIISSGNEADRLPFLRHAALAPMMFRMIWSRGRDRSSDEINEAMLKRGFTEDGAKRAARVFSKNRDLAKLDELEALPAGLPDRGPKPQAQQDQNHRNVTGGLNLPLSTGRAVVPTGITEAEFQLLMQTLRLWKDRLVSRP